MVCRRHPVSGSKSRLTTGTLLLLASPRSRPKMSRISTAVSARTTTSFPPTRQSPPLCKSSSCRFSTLIPISDRHFNRFSITHGSARESSPRTFPTLPMTLSRPSRRFLQGRASATLKQPGGVQLESKCRQRLLRTRRPVWVSRSWPRSATLPMPYNPTVPSRHCSHLPASPLSKPPLQSRSSLFSASSPLLVLRVRSVLYAAELEVLADRRLWTKSRRSPSVRMQTGEGSQMVAIGRSLSKRLESSVKWPVCVWTTSRRRQPPRQCHPHLQHVHQDV